MPWCCPRTWPVVSRVVTSSGGAAYSTQPKIDAVNMNFATKFSSTSPVHLSSQPCSHRRDRLRVHLIAVAVGARSSVRVQTSSGKGTLKGHD